MVIAQKITELTSLTKGVPEDIFPAVDDPDGVGKKTRKLGFGTFLRTYNRTSKEIAAGLSNDDLDFKDDPGDLRRYGALGSGANDTAAIQRTIDSTHDVLVPDEEFLCDGGTLTANNDSQSIYGMGWQSAIKRRSNGDLLTVSANFCQVRDIKLTSDGVLTGDNIVSDGTNNIFQNVQSNQAIGQAFATSAADYSGLKILGGRYNLANGAAALQAAMILGKSTSAQDALFVTLSGFTFNENDAPLIMHRAEASFISNCQIGGLQLLDGNSVESSGVMVRGCRITGDIQIDGPTHLIIGNLISNNRDVTFGTTANGCNWIGNSRPNLITNNGNNDNFFMESIAAGTGLSLKFGDTSDTGIMEIDPSNGDFFFSGGDVRVGNNKTFAAKAVDGSDALTLGVSASDNVAINNLKSAKTINIEQVGTGVINQRVNAAIRMQVDATVTATQTSLLLFDVDNGTLERVTVGAADSGGTGFKVLRILN